MRNLYLTDRFFWMLGILAGSAALSFALSVLFPVVLLGLAFFTLAFIIDGIWLFGKSTQVSCSRTLPRVFGLGDDNTVHLEINNAGTRFLQVTIIEELPVQLQIRNFEKKLQLEAGQKEVLRYSLRPTERGEYAFGCTNLFLASKIGLATRRISVYSPAHTVRVFPSILQMKQLEIKASHRLSSQSGIKKLRRIGHSYVFEQIKHYVRGDDYRSINWKASSRNGELMVNQYEDERAQQLYCIIDKSRGMHMPFDGLSLMDYAINATLAISNIALKKYDKAGLLTFSDKLGGVLKADSKPTQLNALLHALYRESARPVEANYDLLYYAVRKLISTRSLVLLFTNFERLSALDRVLPVLRKINHFHLLVVVLFENTEVVQGARQPVQSVEDIYVQTAARKYLYEKQQIVQKLRRFGIQTVYTKPEALSVQTINTYLELKARGMV